MNSLCSDCGNKKPDDELQVIYGRKYCMFCAEEKEQESERRKARMLNSNDKTYLNQAS